MLSTGEESKLSSLKQSLHTLRHKNAVLQELYDYHRMGKNPIKACIQEERGRERRKRFKIQKVSSGIYFYLKTQAEISLYISKETEKIQESKPSIALHVNSKPFYHRKVKKEGKDKQMPIQSILTKYKLSIMSKILDYLAITPPLKYL